MRCAECGVETAEVAQACAGCGAPSVRRSRVRQRYLLISLIACLILFIAAFIGIQKAPPRSGLSDTMGWIIVLSLAGAALSLSLLISAARQRARTGQVVRLVRCPECGAKNTETGPFCPACAAPALAQPSATASPGDSSPGYAADPATRAARAGFSVTRLRRGYDIEEVDGFLEAVRDTVLGIRDPPLTADEVRDQKFPITVLEPCYDVKEVDAFLAEVAARLRMRCAECGAPAAALTQVCAECGAPCGRAAIRRGGPGAGQAGRAGRLPFNGPRALTDEVVTWALIPRPGLAVPGCPRGRCSGG